MIQLKGYIEQLRALVPPEPGKVQSIDGEGFTDARLGHDEWGLKIMNKSANALAATLVLRDL